MFLFPLQRKLYIIIHSIVTIFFYKTFDRELTFSNALICVQVMLESFLRLSLPFDSWDGTAHDLLYPQTIARASTRIFSNKPGASRENMCTACHQVTFHSKLMYGMNRVCQTTCCYWQKRASSRPVGSYFHPKQSMKGKGEKSYLDTLHQRAA